MKAFLFLILFGSTVVHAHIPLKDAVGRTMMVMKAIPIDAHTLGYYFQDGKQLRDGDEVNYETGGPLCKLGVLVGPDWQNSVNSITIPAGTVFTLTQAYPHIVNIGQERSAIVGYTFSTNNPKIERVSVEPVANRNKAVDEVIKNPNLLDAKIISQCFGDWIAISE